MTAHHTPFAAALPVTMYVAIGDYDGEFSHIGSLRMNITDAADDYAGAMDNGYIQRGWVIEAQTGRDVTSDARRAIRGWHMARRQDFPEWLGADYSVAAE